jgi:hypothetical protein
LRAGFLQLSNQWPNNLIPPQWQLSTGGLRQSALVDGRWADFQTAIAAAD